MDSARTLYRSAARRMEGAFSMEMEASMLCSHMRLSRSMPKRSAACDCCWYVLVYIYIRIYMYVCVGGGVCMWVSVYRFPSPQISVDTPPPPKKIIART